MSPIRYCLFLFGLVMLFAIAGAAPSPPVANFTANVTSGAAPLPVSFTDLSSNSPIGWAWYFGDEMYTSPWTQVNASAGWSARESHSSVVMPDGSIVLMGGYNVSGGGKNDTWRSITNGATWTQMNASAGWMARGHHSSVVMPDGSIVLMGGYGAGYFKNDVWRSMDYGATWTLVNASAGWSARTSHSSVLMTDGSIVLMGGWEGGAYSGLKNDTWRSTNNGTTWTRLTASAGWTARYMHSSVVMPDGSIVLMGGYDLSGDNLKNDTWRSTDNGATWTQMNASAGWTARRAHSSVAMPDGSIVLTGGQDCFCGYDLSGDKNDTWRSTNNGTTWIRVNVSAGWTVRDSHSSVVLRDGSIVLMGGNDGSGGVKNDTWRLMPAGSSARNPSHTYTTPGIFNVALQAYNAGGYSSTRKTGYITVTSSKTKIGVVRNNKTWLLDASGNGAYGAGDLSYTFGTSSDVYVTGDWNGNGKTEIGVVRNNKTWLLDASGNGAYGAGDLIYTFGMAGDVPVTGDWTGNGTTRIGVVRNNKTWILDASGNGAYGAGDIVSTFGTAGDVYVTGDWNNDHKTEIGVVRNNKTWLLDASGNGAYGSGDLTYTFGKAGDVYVTGDWTGTGTTRIGVVRSNTTWLLDASGNGAFGAGDLAYTFGKAGDKYVTGKWN